MSTTATTILPLERRQAFRDRDDVLSYSKREDELQAITIDLADHLASGETISSVAYDDSGVTTSNKSTTSSTLSFDVTSTGETEITVTTSASRTLQFLVRFYERQGSRMRSYSTDYGNW